MNLILLILATIAAGVSMILGFHWFGTTPDDWAGWLSTAVFLYFLSLLAGGVSWPAPLRRG